MFRSSEKTKKVRVHRESKVDRFLLHVGHHSQLLLLRQ